MSVEGDILLYLGIVPVKENAVLSLCIPAFKIITVPCGVLCGFTCRSELTLLNIGRICECSSAAGNVIVLVKEDKERLGDHGIKIMNR